MVLSVYRPQYVALQRWVIRKLGRMDHEWRVLRNAIALFDLLHGRHKLNRRARELLALAAIVHDVGRSIDRQTHPKQGARLILNNDDLPLSKAMRSRLAYLTLHHRGPVPTDGENSILLPGEDVWNLRMLLALLRAADALDSRRLEPPVLRFMRRGKRVRIDCRVKRALNKAKRIFSRRKKFKLLGKMAGCKIEMRIRGAEELAAA
jgi:exopolyphosphatase/guanosine-5'-triphosphate,3'-diphosphate pyrophosphatase